MECRRVCHVNGAAGHCRLVEGIPLLQLGEDVNVFNPLWLIKVLNKSIFKLLVAVRTALFESVKRAYDILTIPRFSLSG